MFLSGIADEAAAGIDAQIRAHEELGWRHIELRSIDGTNIGALDEAAFAAVEARLAASGLRVSCFASQIANWGRPISTDLEVDLAELKRSAPRMRRLGVPFIRCMSYPNCKPPLQEGEWRRRVIERMRALARVAEDEGVVLVHENCDGWGGLGPEQSLELLAEVGSSALKLVFDTGNPIAHDQDSWDYYSRVRAEIVYVHIKDYRFETIDGQRKESACFPGEGLGHVRRIVSDLLARGYDGGFSIEPHITSVIHLNVQAHDPQHAYRTYIEYGRRFATLVQEIDERSR